MSLATELVPLVLHVTDVCVCVQLDMEVNIDRLLVSGSLLTQSCFVFM